MYYCVDCMISSYEPICFQNKHLVIEFDGRYENRFIVTRDRKVIDKIRNISLSNLNDVISKIKDDIEKVVRVGNCTTILFVNKDYEELNEELNKIWILLFTLDIVTRFTDLNLKDDFLNKDSSEMAKLILDSIKDTTKQFFKNLIDAETGRRFVEELIQIAKEQNPIVEAYYNVLLR